MSLLLSKELFCDDCGEKISFDYEGYSYVCQRCGLVAEEPVLDIGGYLRPNPIKNSLNPEIKHGPGFTAFEQELWEEIKFMSFIHIFKYPGGPINKMGEEYIQKIKLKFKRHQKNKNRMKLERIILMGAMILQLYPYLEFCDIVDVISGFNNEEKSTVEVKLEKASGYLKNPELQILGNSSIESKEDVFNALNDIKNIVSDYPDLFNETEKFISENSNWIDYILSRKTYNKPSSTNMASVYFYHINQKEGRNVIKKVTEVLQISHDSILKLYRESFRPFTVYEYIKRDLTGDMLSIFELIGDSSGKERELFTKVITFSSFADETNYLTISKGIIKNIINRILNNKESDEYSEISSVFLSLVGQIEFKNEILSQWFNSHNVDFKIINRKGMKIFKDCLYGESFFSILENQGVAGPTIKSLKKSHWDE